MPVGPPRREGQWRILPLHFAPAMHAVVLLAARFLLMSVSSAWAAAVPLDDSLHYNKRERQFLAQASVVATAGVRRGGKMSTVAYIAMSGERQPLAHPARGAYCRFPLFTARTRLIRKDSKGSN